MKDTFTIAMTKAFMEKEEKKISRYREKGIVPLCGGKKFGFALYALRTNTFNHIVNSHGDELSAWDKAFRYDGVKVDLTKEFRLAILKDIVKNLQTIRSFGNAQIAKDIKFEDGFYRVAIQPIDDYSFHLVTCYKHREDSWKEISEEWGTPRNVIDTFIRDKYFGIYDSVKKTLQREADSALYGGCSMNAIFYGR